MYHFIVKVETKGFIDQYYFFADKRAAIKKVLNEDRKHFFGWREITLLQGNFTPIMSGNFQIGFNQFGKTFTLSNNFEWGEIFDEWENE